MCLARKTQRKYYVPSIALLFEKLVYFFLYFIGRKAPEKKITRERAHLVNSTSRFFLLSFLSCSTLQNSHLLPLCRARLRSLFLVTADGGVYDSSCNALNQAHTIPFRSGINYFFPYNIGIEKSI